MRKWYKSSKSIFQKNLKLSKLAGLRLQKTKFTEIFCSDLGRTKETASYIIPYHPDTSICIFSQHQK